jgi:hypothetical protein
MHHRVASLALFAVGCMWAAPLQAQDSTTALPKLCYRGRPAPKCQRFVLTEVGYYARAAGSRETFTNSYTGNDGLPATSSYTQDDIASQLTWEVGLMANRGPRAALGATLLLGIGHGGGDIGLKGRYRRWLSPDGVALDVGAGVISGSMDGASGGVTASGLTTDVALNAADYGAVVLRMDVMRAEGRTASALYGGVRLGSRPAIAGTGVLALGFVLILAALAGGDY